ncbi:hypothetical protein MMC25_006595 [Agyrium rufum]|nr:hypothetical protein [Agyrium rufum]
MASSTYRRPGALSSLSSNQQGQPPNGPRRGSNDSSQSDSSSSSNLTSLSLNKAPLRQPQPQNANSRPPYLHSASSNASTSSVNSLPRLSIAQVFGDGPSSRRNSPLNPSPSGGGAGAGAGAGGHKRQHSQGFFEPSLPTATMSSQADRAPSPNLSASKIAAQAAMQHQSNSQHARKRSQTVPTPQAQADDALRGSSMKPPPLRVIPPSARKPSGSGAHQLQHGLAGGGHQAAATAAAAAYPRTAQLSPGLTTFDNTASEKEPKLKSERSKIKLFSKPKSIALPGYKDNEQRPYPSPKKTASPGPTGILSTGINASTTSLADPTTSSASSFYSVVNSSTSTLVPNDRQQPRNEDKEGKKQHFLTRQKNKLKDKIDPDHPITLSSASSNSRPLDPSAPQSIYSFAPSSPGPTSTSFAKTVSGLDLRHGGRALREKKKEEKSAAAAAATAPPFESRRSDVGDRGDWTPSLHHSSPAAHSFLGPSSVGAGGTGAGLGLRLGDGSLANLNLQGFGLNNMGPDDAWPYLKAKLLMVFEGEELRTPIEDLNRLVLAHIQRCVHQRAPSVLTEDLRELLQTGFRSLDQTLRGIPDERLVPYLVEMWSSVFGTILPYMQAVFLPLDLEFKGEGSVLSEREAAEFWGIETERMDDPLINELDVRRIVLVSYRDAVILSRYNALKMLFSRLSLESINAVVDFGGTNGGILGSPGFARPGTAGSLDPGLSSYNSQTSTLFDVNSNASRSRAVSNTSAPELPSFAPQTRRFPSHQNQSQFQLQRQQSGQPATTPGVTSADTGSQVTETVARMLQCVSVLASVRSADEAQDQMEDLTKELKLNWLGRGRTGRNRRGFVGTRVVRGGSESQADVRKGHSRMGSLL